MDGKIKERFFKILSIQIMQIKLNIREHKLIIANKKNILMFIFLTIIQ